MTAEDRVRWDERYADAAPPVPHIPELFADHIELFPTSGLALDVACGTGSGSLWLAERGLEVAGFDVSSAAIAVANETAVRLGLSARCRFHVTDLDDGLPPGPDVDLVVCHRCRQPSIYASMVGRLGPGGTLAVAVLSEVGGDQGHFRAPAGELRAAFSGLYELASHEADGAAVFIGRRPAIS